MAMNDASENIANGMGKAHYRYAVEYARLLTRLQDHLKEVPKRSPPKSLDDEIFNILGEFGEVNNGERIWDAIENVYHISLLLIILPGTYKELCETIEALKNVINALQIEVVNKYIFNKLTNDIPTYYN